MLEPTLIYCLRLPKIAFAKIAFICLAACWCAAPASAERIISSLSTNKVLITSNYTGTQLILFGAVEQDAASVPRPKGYDMVVTVIGPRHTLVTRQKDRVLGIWANTASRTFVDAPSYLAVLANRPATEIASLDVLRQQQIGLENAVLPPRANVREHDPFRAALVRIEKEHGLYIEPRNGLTFVTPTLFRAELTLPANVLVGTYDIDFKLFSDGAIIARSLSTFDVQKAGVEQYVFDAARDYGFLYGLATVLMALATGWMASIVFRRD